MIDIHTHILPEIDDGSRSWDESMEMARQAVADGVEVMIATPHYDHPHFQSDAATADGRREELARRLQAARVPLRVVRGGEITLSAHTAERLEERRLPMLGDGPYFLLELPDPIPQRLQEELFSHRLSGRHPILVHVERERRFQESPGLLHRFIELGTPCQVTAQSLEGKFGRRAEKAARLFMEHGMVHFIASDTHGSQRRPPGLSRAVEVARRILGSSDAAEALVRRNPAHVLAGKVLELEPPRPLKKSWFA